MPGIAIFGGVHNKRRETNNTEQHTDAVTNTVSDLFCCAVDLSDCLFLHGYSPQLPVLHCDAIPA
jgi:hypothetical protein